MRWLQIYLLASKINIQGFAPIIRLDRQCGRRAGGVALFISSNIVYKRRLDLENWEFELLFVEFKISNTKFVCGACYRPPNYSAENNLAFLDHLQNCLDRIYLEPNTFVVLLGDFNAHFDESSVSPSTDFGACLYSWMECPSATSMWNNLQVRERNISTVQAFKRSLFQYFDIENYNKLYDFAIDRFSSIIHTRLRLGCCGLNYYLFN